jgi:hypothetical protein
MCRHCWEEEGAPRIDTPAIRAARDLIQRVYDFNDVGGGLHVVVDDWNIEDDDLVKRYAAPDDGPEQVVAEEECLAALRALTQPERASALALYDGFWTLDEQRREE